MTAGGRVLLLLDHGTCTRLFKTRVHVPGTCGQELRAVDSRYVWARIAQLPAADASTCRQCLVHLIRGGGMLMFGHLFPAMFNAYAGCWGTYLVSIPFQTYALGAHSW